MANCKKLENLVKDFETVTDENLNEIVNCPDVDVSTLSDREKFACLVYQQMSRAIDNKAYKLVLDCNYPQSNKHNKSEAQLAKGQSPEWLVDYFRLISKEGKQKSLIQIYVYADPKKGTCTFNLCTSSAVANLEQFEAMQEELQFIPVPKKGGGAKTSKRDKVSYDDLIHVCKAVVAVLSATEKAKAEAKKAKEASKNEDAEETEE